MAIDKLDGQLLGGRVVPDHHDGRQVGFGLGDLTQYLAASPCRASRGSGSAGGSDTLAHTRSAVCAARVALDDSTRPGRGTPSRPENLPLLESAARRALIASVSRSPRGPRRRSRSAPPGGGSCRVLAWRSNQRWRSFSLGRRGTPQARLSTTHVRTDRRWPLEAAAGAMSPDGSTRSGSRGARVRAARARGARTPGHVRAGSPWVTRATRGHLVGGAAVGSWAASGRRRRGRSPRRARGRVATGGDRRRGVGAGAGRGPREAAVAPSEMPNAAAVTEPITRLRQLWVSSGPPRPRLSPPLPRSHHSTLGPSWQPAVR